MVSNSALAAVSVHHGLHRFLITESKSVKKAIDEYIPEVEEKQRLEYAAADEEGRPKGQYWLEVEPPKVSWARTLSSCTKLGSSLSPML